MRVFVHEGSFSRSHTIMAEKVRLQKVIAAAGIASRRKAEELIQSGRVRVNGKVVRELGTKVDPAVDVIEVDGEVIRVPQMYHYIVLHKPRGVISTTSDPLKRTTVLDLVESAVRLFPVGRLDADSEGLVLLTNDGELTERLSHPRYGHTKEYIALVIGVPDTKALRALEHGIVLEEGRTQPAKVVVLGRHLPQEIQNAQVPGLRKESPRGFSWVRISIKEGKKHQVRRMLKAVGHPVIRLIRVGLGPLRLGTLAPGEARPLTPKEQRRLLESVGLARKAQEQSRALKKAQDLKSSRSKKAKKTRRS